MNNREEVEKEFLALILNKNEIIEITQILPKYLNNKDLSKIFEYSIECYKENKSIMPIPILEKHKDFDVDLYTELLTNTFFQNITWKNQLKYSENYIIDNYKQDIQKELNKKLESKEIKYSEFVKNVKKLDEIKINSSNNLSMLTIQDIDDKSEESITYVKSNCKLLDNSIKGFALGQLSVWSGGNASAKSTYLNQIAIESINQQYNVAIYSGELVAKRLLKWISMQCAGKENMLYNKEKDYWYIKQDCKNKIYEWLNNKLFIYDNNFSNKARDILNSIEDCVERNNIKVIILDNLMSMNLNSYGDNKYDVQSQFIQDLSSLAKKLNVHIHFVCHPRKSTSFLRKVDISGSADLTNIADNVFIMHRVNQDFKIRAKEMFKWLDNYPLFEFTNVIEICKNRDFGIEDTFIGMYFEIESKRLLNERSEIKYYGWKWL